MRIRKARAAGGIARDPTPFTFDDAAERLFAAIARELP